MANAIDAAPSSTRTTWWRSAISLLASARRPHDSNAAPSAVTGYGFLESFCFDQNWHCDLCQAVVLPLTGPGGHAWGFIRVRAVVAASALPAYAPPWTQGHSPLPGSGAAAAAQTARVVGRGINIKANKKAQQ